jgi:hypothetical protein
MRHAKRWTALVALALVVGVVVVAREQRIAAIESEFAAATGRG